MDTDLPRQEGDFETLRMVMSALSEVKNHADEIELEMDSLLELGSFFEQVRKPSVYMSIYLYLSIYRYRYMYILGGHLRPELVVAVDVLGGREVPGDAVRLTHAVLR